MDVLHYIQESCAMQNATTDDDLIGMTVAWCYASSVSKQSKVFLDEDILWIARYVRNDKDLQYRTTPVTFTDGGNAVAAQHIERQINLLLNAQRDITPEEFYQRLMEIHPFDDGNGRTGSIIYNWMMGTIDNPTHPPMFRKK